MVLAAVVMSSGAIRLMRSNEGSCLRVTYRVSSINSIVRADPLCSARVRSEVGAFDLQRWIKRQTSEIILSDQPTPTQACHRHAPDAL